MFVQFSDESETKVVSVFDSPQDKDNFPNQATVNDDDPRYLAFTNPLYTPEGVEAYKIGVVQNHMDDAARTYRYDNIASAITYAEEPSVPKFQNEGQAFRAWRSLVWAKCYEILDDVESGEREIPTDEELISELPILALPTDEQHFLPSEEGLKSKD